MKGLLPLLLLVWLFVPMPGQGKVVPAGIQARVQTMPPGPCCPGETCETGGACCQAAAVPVSVPVVRSVPGARAWPGYRFPALIQPPRKRLERPPRLTMSPL